MMLKLVVLVALTAVCLAHPSDDVEVPEGGIKCGKWTVCGVNSRCTKTNGYDDCACQEGFYGSGYAGCTAEPQCVDDSGCSEDEVCKNNLCSGACMSSCPADVGCKVKNHVAECIFDGALFFDPPPSTPQAPAAGASPEAPTGDSSPAPPAPSAPAHSR